MTHCTALHPHKESDDEKEWQEDGQQTGEPVWLGSLEVVVDALLLEELFVSFAHQHCASGCELATVFEFTRNDVVGVVDGDLTDVSIANKFKELCVGDLVANGLRDELTAEGDDHDRCNDCPDGPLGHGWLGVCAWLLLVVA